MKPLYILIFILLVFGGMTLLSYIIPEDGYEITEGVVIHFPTIDEILNPKENKYVDISEIIEKNQVPDTLDSETDELATAYLKDSSIVYYQPLNIKPGEVTQKLEFPGRNKTVLYSFFNELSNLAYTKKLIRVLHYGDSQIEADRMTSYIRSKLQSQFGGTGPGLIPAIQPYGFRSPVVSESTGEWKRYTGFLKRDTTVKHSRYGVMASFSRFAPFPENYEHADSLIRIDSILNPTKEYSASLTISHSPYSTRNVKQYSKARLFYGYNTKPFNLKLYADETLVSNNTLVPSENLQLKTWKFNNTPTNLHFEFNGEDSPDIYAMTLDGTHGVAVDNIALRGSGGLIFTNSNKQLLASIYQKLNVKLIILQFGGNITPHILDNYNYYERSFYRQLTTLKRLIPGVSIIVIGLADMSLKEKDTYVSYPNVTLIRDALKNASFKAGCAFWDMYEAMGSKNSMPSWVFSEPPLAEKDFTHFTVKGSRIIAKMFYSALMLEYNDYINKQNKLKKNDEEKAQYSYNKN